MVAKLLLLLGDSRIKLGVLVARASFPARAGFTAEIAAAAGEVEVAGAPAPMAIAPATKNGGRAHVGVRRRPRLEKVQKSEQRTPEQQSVAPGVSEDGERTSGRSERADEMVEEGERGRSTHKC